MSIPTSPPATSLPLTIKYPTFPPDTPQEMKDAITRLYDIISLHASQIEVLRTSLNTKT